MLNIRRMLAILAVGVMPAVVSAASLSSEQLDQVAKSAMAHAEGRNLAMIVVPAADNYLSTMMVVGVLKSGSSSTHSEAIQRFLEGRQKAEAMLVVGENETLTAATVARALEDGKGRSSAGVRLIVALDDAERRASLAALAEAADVSLVFVPQPQ